MNKVILMGRLTRDPEVRYSSGDSSMAIARYSLAVDRRGRRNGNGDEPTTDFFNCVAFGRRGEFAEKYLKKGLKIEVHGRLEQNTWTTKEGEKRSNVRIMAEDIEFGESKSQSESNSASSEAKSAPEQPKKEEPKDTGFMDIPVGDMPEELPFA